MQTTIAINGKWLSQPTTGTQRYAEELVRRLACQLPARAELHAPSNADIPGWVSNAYTVHRHKTKGLLFEQFTLPWATRRSLLINLVGPAPIVKRFQIVAMHDAAVFRFPATHSRRFRYWYRLMFHSLARSAAAVLTVSNFSAHELADVLGVSRAKFSVITNGADHVDRLEPQPIDVIQSLNEPFVLCLGTMAEHKNLTPILTELNSSRIHVVVVGAAGAQHIFGASSNISGRYIHLMGRLSDGEIAWLYRSASLLLFPSLYEGFGLPVAEAQRLGCPVVCSDAASLPEVAGSAALFYDASDANRGVALARTVMSNSEVRENLAVAGKRNAERYTWDASAERLSRIVHDLVSPHS